MLTGEVICMLCIKIKYKLNVIIRPLICPSAYLFMACMINSFELLLVFRFATLLHQCLGAIKKGSKKASANEIALASHAIGKFFIKLIMFHIFIFYLFFVWLFHLFFWKFFFSPKFLLFLL